MLLWSLTIHDTDLVPLGRTASSRYRFSRMLIVAVDGAGPEAFHHRGTTWLLVGGPCRGRSRRDPSGDRATQRAVTQEELEVLTSSWIASGTLVALAMAS